MSNCTCVKCNQIAELEVKCAHFEAACMTAIDENEAMQATIKELREVARAVVDSGEQAHGGCGSSYIVNQQKFDVLVAILEETEQ